MGFEYFNYISETDGRMVKHKTLLSMHFGRLSAYQENWSIYDVLVFEAMLVLSRRYGNKEFYHQQRFLERYTRLSAHLIRNSLDKLKKLGFISVRRKGRKKMNYYKVHYDTIKNKLGRIYDFSEEEPGDKKGYMEMMRNFYDYWAANSYDIPEKREVAKDEVPADSRDPFRLSTIDKRLSGEDDWHD